MKRLIELRNMILIIILFLIVIFIMTYPLILKISSYMPGFFSTDESYIVPWNAWLIKHSLSTNYSIKTTNFITYPFGVRLLKTQFSYLFFFVNYCLSILTTPVLTYNIQIIVNFLLSSTFVYLLVSYISKNHYAGFLSGIIFAFCPYVFVRSWQHLMETYVWMMPAVLLALFMLRDNTSRRAKILFILTIILTTINFGAVYYVSIIMATFFIYGLLYYLMNKHRLEIIFMGKYREFYKTIFLLSLLASMLLLFQFYPILKNTVAMYKKVAPSAFNAYHRPFEDLFAQSARPLSYLLPATVHPIFGKFTENFIGSQIYGGSFTEHTLYLGWTTIILAFIAFKALRKRRQKEKIISYESSTQTEDFYIGFFSLLTIVAWLFSQPPWWKIGSLKILMPSFFMYKIIPMFRAYCRFGIVVMLAFAVLAGFGLKLILEKFKMRKSKIFITTLFCGLILFEFWNYPPFKVIDVSVFPSVYYWLRGQSKDVVIAEYPLDAESPNETYRFYQIMHEKKMINYTIPGTYPNRVAKTITKLSYSHTAEVLKWMGVKYVLVHKKDYLSTELIEDIGELDKIPNNPYLKLIKSFPSQECLQRQIACIQRTGPIDVYEVIAQPIKPEVGE